MAVATMKQKHDSNLCTYPKSNIFANCLEQIE